MPSRLLVCIDVKSKRLENVGLNGLLHTKLI
jgi:hypothetical protein